jgi:glycosyltransferase involved in cell wall biosynthesis
MAPKVVAVIPAYNEAKRIRETIIGTKKFVDKIIVVDDGSPDGTAKVAKAAGVQVMVHDVNRGKGAAIRTAFNEVFKLRPEIIVLIDADGQHDPKYIPYFIDAIRKGADYVCGRRDLSSYPLNRKIGNLCLTILTNLFCPTGIMDTEGGFRALTLSAARKMELKADRYGIEMDFAYSVWKNKLRVKQIQVYAPVFYSKAAIGRGFRNFFYLVRRRFRLI